jgi:hypothetical protein
MPRPDWRPFEEAREFARSLRLANNREWRALCRGQRPDRGSLPDDTPSQPHVIYCFRGFIGYGDWLGHGAIGSRVSPRIHYEEASEYVVPLGITTESDFLDRVAGRRPDLPPKPLGLPTCPNRDYAGQGWTNWGDFLGTGRIANMNRVFRPFAEAREFARSLGLRSRPPWEAWAKGFRPELPPPATGHPLQTGTELPEPRLHDLGGLPGRRRKRTPGGEAAAAGRRRFGPGAIRASLTGRRPA